MYNIIIDCIILCRDRSAGITTARLELETEYMPAVGMTFEHSVWKAGRSIVHINTDLQKFYHVIVEEMEVPDRDGIEKEKEIFRLHKWNILGE